MFIKEFKLEWKIFLEGYHSKVSDRQLALNPCY